MRKPSPAPDRARVLEQIEKYYRGCLERHGPTPRGVDWNSEESQSLRFRQLMKIHDRSGPFSVIDYGCGYGALARYLRKRRPEFEYQGYDVSDAMIQEARRWAGGDRRIRFSADAADLRPADYTVASGIFNVKLRTPREAWRTYVLETIDELARLSRRGFAFNMLTDQIDADKARDDLYYADPGFFFDHCRRNCSRRTALLHDYPLYEFTILVRL